MSITDVQQTASNPSLDAPRPRYNGKMFKEPDTDPVYMVDHGLKRYLSNFNLFRPGSVVTPFDMECIDEGSPVYENAVIITDGGPAYLVDVNPAKGSKTIVKRVIGSAETFDQYQFNWEKIQRVPAIVVAGIPDGEAVLPRS